jgi:sortase A
MALRIVERVLLLAGLALLGLWATARLHSVLGSRAAISRFRADEPSLSPTAFDRAMERPVDFRLWSKNRIVAYQASLANAAVMPVAILLVPRLNLEAPVFNGTDDLTLNRGVGRIQGTAEIGQAGNVGIAGHRDGFFRALQNVTTGDVVELEQPGTTSRYVVDEIEIVNPDDTQVLSPTPTAAVTLVTCYPFYFVGSAPKRFIVRATQTVQSTQVSKEEEK